MKSKAIERYFEEDIEIFNKRFGVVFNGPNNLRDLAIENLIDSSPTAFQCAWLYQRFLGGGGFVEDLTKIDIGNGIFPYTPVNLLYDIAESLSRHQAFFLHVGYNFNYDKISFKVIPHTLCKVGKKDSSNYSGKIVYSPKGWGKELKKENVRVYDAYNPLPEVIEAQVQAAGGWNKYKGQILYFKFNKKHTYGKSLLETAIDFAATEHSLGMFYNGTARRGFENTTIIRHRKFPNREDQDDFDENIKKVTGFENASSVLMVEDDWDDEREKTGNFKFDTLKNDVQADKYKHFEESSANYIRKAFKNIPPQLVDYVAGKLGNTSGEDLIKAQAVYNSIISQDQEIIEIVFRELFTNYYRNINPSGNWTIKQYKLLDNGTVNYGPTN